MENPNLEFIIDKDRDSDSLDDIRVELFNCLLEIKNITLQKNCNFFNNTILLSFLNDNNNIKLEKKEKEVFLKFLDMFRQDDIFITCEKSYMEYMKILFGPKLFTILRNKFMYCKGSSLTDQQTSLIKKVTNLLKSGIGYYEDYEEINNMLNLKNLKSVKISDEKDISKIFTGKNNSDYYLLSGHLDEQNIRRMKESRLLCFEYLNNSVTSKYYLVKSLMKIGYEENLPTFSLKKIVENLKHSNYLETVSYQMYLKLSSFQKIENLQVQKFDNLEKAISYNILLAKNGIHGIMIPHHLKFHICYQSNNKINYDPDNLVSESKKELLKNLSKQEIKDNKLDEKSLHYLVNITRIEFNKKDEGGELILPEDKKLFTKNNFPVPIDVIESRNLYHYNLFNDILKVEKNYYSFDRDKINIDVDIEINFTEKIDFIYSLTMKNTDLDVTLERDIFIDGEVEQMEDFVRKIWKKGYFMTDYSIHRYNLLGKIKNQDIKFPEWFVSREENSYSWLLSTLKSI